MAMASWMFRGRILRSGRSTRSRHDSEDEVQLDFSKDANENAREILSHICKKQGLTEGKRFSYLSAFVKLITKSDIGAGGLGYSIEDLQCCLRVALVHEASQVRAAALRAVRYLLKEEKDVRILNKLRYPCLICRSLDLMLRNDSERVQALRLVRRMLVLAPMDFPISLVRSLVSLANGAAEEKDRMLRSCLATLAEICVLNPDSFISCGGVSAVIRNLLDCQMPRIAESLCGVLLFLLNSPATRSQAGICLQSLAAPYCDFHLNSDRNRDEREVQFHCSRLVLLSVLRSWPGILHFCHPANSSGLRSLVNILYLKQLEVRKGILDLLYELLGLPQPEWTDEFSVALEAVDPSHPRDTWKLQDGFISAEGRDILPHLSRFRPNIVEIHLAILLYTFVQAGLLEAIVEVIVSSDTFICVRASVLLGELLHLIHNLLPPECCNLTPALPNLLSHASNASVPSVQHHALSAVAILSHLHGMLKRRPAPASLFLDRTLQGGGWGREESKAGKRSKLYTLVAPKEGDDFLKDSAVLTHKDGFSWNWNIVRAVLKSRSEFLKKLEDSNHRTFLKRLVHYFKPSSNCFSRVELGNKKQTQMYTLAGLELIDCLLEVEEAEGMKLLNELLADMWVQIDAITSCKSAHDCLFSPQHMSNSVCQDYFLFIGRLCRCSKGLRVLDKAGIFQQLLHLVVSTNHDCYVKLVVSGLDYSIDGMPRVILSEVLTAPSESSRLYATQFLLVLLRARLPDFQKWGIELLVMQLYDQSKAVSLAAIAILGEATEEKVYLDAVISMRPSLLHLGDKGLLLLIRFLSTPNGFTFLQDANFVTTQLDRWSSNYNYRYVRLVEGDIHDSLTLHQCGEDGRYSRRVTGAKHYVRDVFIPPHLYGQLVQHEKGFQLLVKEGKLHNLFQCVHNRHCSSEQEILKLKAALWGCGHVATSSLGISLLAEHGIVQAVLHLAQNCPVYSVRGTAFYVLGLLATTFEGANLLNKAGWLCVRHHRHDRWPVITSDNEDDESDAELMQHSGLYSDGDNISFSSEVPSGWESNCSTLTQQESSTIDSSQDSNPGRFYIPGDDDDVDSIESGDDEGFHLEETRSSTKWFDLPGSNCDDTIQQQHKSRTLPHPRHHSFPAAPFRHRHFRSLSECKETHVQAGDWALGPSGTIKDSSRGEQENKGHSNSCTDSSGVSSCDSGLAHTGKLGGVHEQTLSPIPSSTSLNTLKSGAVTEQSKGSQVTYKKFSPIHGSVNSGLISPDTSSSCLSQQDVLGYATLRSLHRYRRPLYSDTVSLAAMELLMFDEHRHITSSSRSASVSRALKVRSLDRQYVHPGMCEFEASLPPQLLSGASSVSLAARTYIGSRSNLVAARHSGLVTESSSTQQCYMGICLPRELASLYPRDDPATRSAEEKGRDYQRGSSERQRSTSLGEMEDLQEAGEEDIDTSFSSDSEDFESQMKTNHSAAAAAASDYRHSSANCLACCRLRDRKISASSYHRYRTDTESSYGGGESPVLLPRRRKSNSASSCLLGLTPGGSVESGNSTSLDIGPCHQRVSEEVGTPSKALIRREILKHVMRMSNPVWIKVSKQVLLQLKQQYPAVFQDVCLYSEVSHRIGSATYRLSARRFLQELFLDLQFDALYEEPAAILQIQQSVAEGTNAAAAAASPQSTGHSSTTSSSPNMTNVSTNQDIVDGLLLHNLPHPHGSVINVEQSLSPTGNLSEVTSGKIPCQECLITNEEKPSESENTTYKFGLNTRTVSLDIVPPCKVLVLQGVYAVRSPPLEVVKEESVATVSHLDSLSKTDTTESDLVPDNCPVGNSSEQLYGVFNPVIVSARNEILISAAQDANSNCNNSLSFRPASQLTAVMNQSLSDSTEDTKPHTLDYSVKDIPSPAILSEQRPQVYPKESVVFSFMIGEEEKEAAVGRCVTLLDSEKVGSCDLLVAESKCQELVNLNLPTQNMFTVSQVTSGSGVNVISSVSSPLLSSAVSGSVIKNSVQKVPETQNKHIGESATHVERRTVNCLSQTASYPNTLSMTNSRLKYKSVLMDSSDLLLANRPKPETYSKATESSPCVKAVVVHEVSLPELSVPCQTQASMPSQGQSASASDEVIQVNKNSHMGGLSLLSSGAKGSQNKQTLCKSLNEDPTASFKKFPEEKSSIIAVPTKAVVIGTRQRKLATTCPPNISSLTKTVGKTVPSNADSKKTQYSESSCTSGSSNFIKGETVKMKSKLKK
ncbi:rapamycin-insensitive companion of mTOR isoform X2 [Zootermopsis nevadensis]|uniref:rapamycin-insensitive companion of mTOR isoform X2 n=1 Tax=Zootermopsis nevadensis TaxID=136037 RepID=UPI000B8E51FC|nr:rapamycin-insensitive companion of mTOR isoform X2 [Zootermopsis nevadensis]